MKLRANQEAALSAIKTDRALLLAPMGSGKTLTAAVWLQSKNKALPAVIVAPKRVIENNWPQTLATLGLKYCLIDSKADFSSAPIILSSPYYLARLLEVLWAPWYEQLGAKAIKLPKLFSALILDESSCLKGYSPKLTHASSVSLHVRALNARSESALFLTASPHDNYIEHIWPQMLFIDGGECLGRTRKEFNEAYGKLQQKNIRGGMRDFWCFENKAEEIMAKVATSRHVVRMGAPKVTEAITIRESVQYSRREYATFKRDSVLLGVVAESAADKASKLLQLASGFIYDKDRKAHWIDDSRIQAAVELVALSGEPCLVVYIYIAQKERFLELARSKLVVSELDDKGALGAWNGRNLDVLILHPKSGGHGLDLQHGGRRVVWLSRTHDAELYNQTNARCGPVRQAQSGYQRDVFVHYFHSEGTHEDVLTAVLEGRVSKLALTDQA